MRWPIRNQILLPFLLVQVIATATIAAISAAFAVDQAAGRIDQRLGEVRQTLDTAWYPLTAEILDQLTRLSGAEFVVLDAESRVRQSTLPRLPRLDPDDLQAVQQSELNSSADASSLSRRPRMTLGEATYFAEYVRPRWRDGRQSVLVLFPVASWKDARQQALWPPLMIGTVLLLVTVLLSFWIAGRLSRRIQRVRQQVAGIAEGQFQPWPVVRTDDELRDLGVSVNRMAAIVEDSLRTIRNLERSQVLTQLVGGLSHQIRNALTGARTSIQLHRRHCSNRSDEAIDVALRQLTLTEEQIKSLLRLTRGESGPPRPAPIADIVQETLALVRPLCTHRQIRLDGPSVDTPTVVRDSEAIRGALLNLIMNAIEAAGPQGDVQVRLFDDPPHTVLEVGDTGPGIPDAIRDEIFTPFFTTKAEGAGLGLALARQAAVDSDGSLTVRRENDRTLFSLRLPADPPASATGVTTAAPGDSAECHRRPDSPETTVAGSPRETKNPDVT